MFCKLAARNVLRSVRDYGVYLLTLTFGVCLFYTFNAIEGQGVMAYLAAAQSDMVRVIQILIDVFSVFVSVVLACLIVYADRFLMRRRKRELGTCLILGMSQGQVSRMLFLETGLIGLVSLLLGLGLGVGASYGLSALTLSMFQMDASLLALSFSVRAAGKTALYFGLIFLLVMALNGVQVARARLIDLLQGERRNEELKPVSLKRTEVQFCAGVLCLLAAYAILLGFGMAVAVAVMPICIPMLALGTAGTLLIFRSLSGFVLRLVRSRPGLYYRDLNMFTLRQWISRVHTAYLSQTVICILLLLAIGITASSIGLNSTLNGQTDRQAPFDLSVQYQGADQTGPIDFPALLGERGVASDRFTWQESVTFYYNDPAITGVEDVSAAVRLSDLDGLRARAGMSAYSGAVPGELTDWESIPVTGDLGLSCAVIPDEMAQQLKVRRQIWSADYAGDAAETEQAVAEILQALSRDYVGLRLNSRQQIYAGIMGSKILALFLGLYLGFTFLLAAAAVLALQQLSQGADNTKRYRTLRRLGAEEGMVGRSAVQQVALAFLLPLALALIHSVVGMKAANDVIAMAGQLNVGESTVATALVLLLVYGGYFLATALACRRMAMRN